MKKIIITLLLYSPSLLFSSEYKSLEMDTPKRFWNPKESIGQNQGDGNGVKSFRGNLSRTYYGSGPLPEIQPDVLWKYPEDHALVGMTYAYKKNIQWTGTGWTGQPVIWKREDGVLELIVGASDYQVHFLNAEDGSQTRPPFLTSDIIKGSVSLDPDGYPLLYFGSRDNYLRIVSIEGAGPGKELWKLNGQTAKKVWDNDWDGNPVVLQDHMFVGGENSWLYGVKLNRSKTAEGHVKIEPEMILEMPGFTPELLKNLGDRNVAIESSVALYEDRLYFTNSGGRIVGINMNNIQPDKNAEIVFDYWTGDDTDASPVLDSEGMLYVASQSERKNARSKEVGQFLKLNPYQPENPLLWNIHVVNKNDHNLNGIWATPALGKELIFVSTHGGDLLAVDQKSGEIVWRKRIGFHAWSSPLMVDGVLLVGLCSPGGILALDIKDERNPVELWKLDLPGCIESTPVVWEGKIYVGSRDGYIYGIGTKTLE